MGWGREDRIIYLAILIPKHMCFLPIVSGEFLLVGAFSVFPFLIFTCFSWLILYPLPFISISVFSFYVKPPVLNVLNSTILLNNSYLYWLINLPTNRLNWFNLTQIKSNEPHLDFNNYMESIPMKSTWNMIEQLIESKYAFPICKVAVYCMNGSN